MASGNGVSGVSGYRRWNWCAVMDAWEVSRTKTSITFRVQLGYSSYYAINVYGNGQIDGGAGWNGSLNVGGNGYWQRVNVATSDFTVSRTGGAYTKTFSGRVSATGGFGNGTSWVSVSVSVPQREYDIPKRPANFNLARVSDTSQRMTWTGDYTDMNGATPWSTVRVNRNTDDAGRVNIASLPWSAVNYDDNSTGAGHKYAYDVESTNPAGTSPMSGQLTVYTTPVSPSRVTASKVGAGKVELAISGHSRWWDSAEVEVTSDGGSQWNTAESSVKSGSGSGDVVIQTSTVPAGTVTYRVRLVKGDLKSEWVESQQVVTITPPLAPTIGKLAGAYATGSTIAVRWEPNHPDGSQQTSAQVELSGPDAKTMNVGNTPVATVVLSKSGACAIRVRTKGLHAEWGAWSDWVPFTVAEPPSAWFTVPSSDGTVVDAMPVEVAWEISDKTGVSAQSLTVAKEGQQQSTVTVTPKDRKASITGLDNDSTYSLKLTVRGGSGLEKAFTRTFKTKWRPPAKPNAQVDVLDGLACSVLLYAGTESGAPATKSLSVRRVMPDGSTLLLGSGLTPGQSVIDRLPPLNVEIAYRVTAVAESGSSATSDVKFTVDSGGMEVFNFGQDASGCISLGLEASVNSSMSAGGEWFHFATGPGEPPIPSFYPDGTMSASGSASYIVTTPEEYRALDSIRRDPTKAVCWYRNHWGGRMRALVSWSLAYSAQSYGVWEVSASITEETWEEPVNA